jgi:hypothetical protein
MPLIQSRKKPLCAGAGTEPRYYPDKVDVDRFARTLSDTWLAMCSRFLPEGSSDSKWRYSRKPAPADPEQGWKLHVSATPFTACEILQRVAPLLLKRGVLYKVPSSLQELNLINSGLHYGYSQVGKFMTVYPRSDKEAVNLACILHRRTQGLKVPAVPFDLEFRAGSCVYYRYGAFKPIWIVNQDGTQILAIRNPKGELVPDSRDSPNPTWVSDPFIRPSAETTSPDNPLKTTFRVFRALSQRGKGGVYQAIDFSADPPRLCVVKEGRRGGEISWDGRDGSWRVKNEERVLRGLLAAGINVPRVYSSFKVEGNYYLAIEFIEGESLHAMLARRRRRLTVTQTLVYAIKLCGLISQLHDAGWIWRDCKPSNLIVTKKGELRPLDFEGACPVDQPDGWGWGSYGFSPEQRQADSACAQSAEDVYSVGAIAYFLLTGRLLDPLRKTPIWKLRRHVPLHVRKTVSDMVAADPARRPTPAQVLRRFQRSLGIGTKKAKAHSF